MSLLWDMTSRNFPTAKNWLSTTFISSAAKSKRPENTTSRACSFAWVTPSIRLARNELSWTPSNPFSPACPNTSILRAELRRLFRWLKDKGVTAIVTGERGDRTLTRQGLEEYVSDCVILLDHPPREQIYRRQP